MEFNSKAYLHTARMSKYPNKTLLGVVSDVVTAKKEAKEKLLNIVYCKIL